MLRKIEVPENQKMIGVVQKFEVMANGKLLGDIVVLKNGHIYASATRPMGDIGQAERWLKFI